MKTAKCYLLDLWRDLCGADPSSDAEWELMRCTEWSHRFELLMRNRLLMGSLRYETWAEKRKKFNYDCASEAIRRVQLYQRDGNKEHLVDAANMCLLQFEFGPGSWKPADDGEHQVQVEP
jgi:hypothetical protein